MTTVREVAEHPNVWSARELTGGHERPTDRMLQDARDHDKVPAWSHRYIERIVTETMSCYAGVRKTPTRAHVFVIDGVRRDGVHAAGFDWVAHVGGGFASEVAEREWADDTPGTMLGGVCEAILGDRIVEDYVRGDFEDENQRDAFDDLSVGAEDEPPPTDGPASSHPIAPDDAVPIDDVDAGPPRVSLRCPGCDVEHGDWEIRRTDGGKFLIARCGRCEGESAFRFHGFMSDGFPA